MFFAPKRFTDISGYYYKTYEDVSKVMGDEITKLERRNDFPLPWAKFFGWDPELIPDLPKLSADFLDKEFTTTFPVVVVGESGHVAWVNHKAFEVSSITT